METFVWLTCLIVVIILLEPLLPQALDLLLKSFGVWIKTQITKIQLYVPLAIQRRSLRNDALGRLLRTVDLWRIRNNPAFREFFNNDQV